MTGCDMGGFHQTLALFLHRLGRSEDAALDAQHVSLAPVTGRNRPVTVIAAVEDARSMSSKIATLGLKWKAFRSFFDFAPTDAELARGPFLLGEEHGAQVFSKMLSGDQGVPIDLLQIMADRINRQALAHRARHAAYGPLDGLAMTAADLGPSPIFDYLRRLVALSPVVDADRLDSLHRDLMEQLSAPVAWTSDDLKFSVERFTRERSFAPFKGGEGPTVFEPGRHLGQFQIEGPGLVMRGASPMLYVFLRRDTAMLGRRAWDENFTSTVEWLPSPFRLDGSAKAVNLFAEPMPVSPEPGEFRVSAVLVRDPQALRTLDPRLDRRKPVTDMPPPMRFDEPASVRFLTNLGRALERRDGAVAVATADYIVTGPTPRQT